MKTICTAKRLRKRTLLIHAGSFLHYGSITVLNMTTGLLLGNSKN